MLSAWTGPLAQPPKLPLAGSPTQPCKPYCKRAQKFDLDPTQVCQCLRTFTTTKDFFTLFWYYVFSLLVIVPSPSMWCSNIKLADKMHLLIKKSLCQKHQPNYKRTVANKSK